MNLTKAIKEDIVASVINRTLNDRKRAANVRMNEVADMVYRSVFTPEELSVIKSLPDGWLWDELYIRVSYKALDKELVESCKAARNFGDYHSPLQYDHVKLEFSSCRRFPFNLKSKEHESLNPEALTALTGFLTEYLAIKASEKQLRITTKALLSGVRTDKQLLAAWPEGAQYLPTQVSDGLNLPAVTARELNDLIAVLKPVAGDDPTV